MAYVDERDLHDSVLAINAMARMATRARPDKASMYRDVASLAVADLHTGMYSHHLLCYVAMVMMMKARVPDDLAPYYRRVRDVQAGRWVR